MSCVENQQLSLPEYGQDKGDFCGHQESTHSASFSEHQRCCCGEGECTSLRTSPGPTPPHPWPRKLTNVSTSSVSWEEPQLQPPSCARSAKGTIESILTCCITVWYGAYTTSCCKTLHGIVRAAEKIGGTPLPFLQNIYSTHLTRKALCIAGDATCLSHSFSSLLLLWRLIRLISLQARSPPGCQEAEVFAFSAPFWIHKLWTSILQQGDS